MPTETPFPRGGTLNLPKTDVKKRKQQHAHTQDDSSMPKKAAKKHDEHGTDSSTTSERVWMQKFDAEVISNGVLVLGCIRRVEDTKILVDLPDRLEGVIEANRVSIVYSDSVKKGLAEVKLLPEMYEKGQLLCCCVVGRRQSKPDGSKPDGTGRRPLLDLSIDPDHINRGVNVASLMSGLMIQACVSSIEDRGYIMNIGMPSVRAFLSFDRCQSLALKRNLPSNQIGQLLSIGQSLMCCVAQGQMGINLLEEDGNRVLNLTLDVENEFLDVENNGRAKVLPDQLTPGTRLSAKVAKILTRRDKISGDQEAFGLFVHLGTKDNFITGFLSHKRLKNPVEDPGSYDEGSDLEVVVLATKSNTEMLYLSAQEHLVGMESPGVCMNFGPFSEIRVGELLKAQVLEVTRNEGVFFFARIDRDTPTESLMYGYAHRGNLQGEHRVPELYEPGSMHTARVLSLNLFDQILIISTQKSVLSQKLVSVEDAQIGMKLKGAIHGIGKTALFIKFYKHIDGVVDILHSADAPPKRLEKRFEKGQQVTCRVISVDLDRNRLNLTMKPSLVNSTLPIITGYDPSDIGNITDGVVVLVKDNGILVKFYNHAAGWVSKKELELQSVLDPQKSYSVGQVIRVRVQGVYPETERINLSINLGSQASAPTETNQLPNESAHTSSFSDKKISCTILKCNPDRGFEVAAKFEAEEKCFTAFLPIIHMADSVSLAKAIASTYSVGDEIPNCCLISSTGPKSIVSAKHSIVQAVCQRGQPCLFDALEPRKPIVGEIRRKHPELGLFLDFPGGLSGLIRYNATGFGDNPEVLASHPCYTPGQTIATLIASVDSGKRRITLTAKSRDRLVLDLRDAIDRLAHDLRLIERLRIYAFKSKNLQVRTLAELNVGSVAKFWYANEVNGAKHGFLDAEKTLKAVVIDPSEGLDVGSSAVDCLIVDLDLLNGKALVSIDKEHIKIYSASKLMVLPPKLGAPVMAKLLAVTELYGILSFTGDELRGRIGYLPSQLFMGDVKGMSELALRVGKEISVIPRQMIGNQTVLCTLQQDEQKFRWSVENAQARSTERTLGKSDKSDKHKIPLGSVCSAEITQVSPDGLKLLLDDGLVKGFVHGTELARPKSDSEPPCLPTQGYTAGSKIDVRVLRRHKVEHDVIHVCSADPNKLRSKRFARRAKLKPRENYLTHEQVLAIITEHHDGYANVSVTDEWIGKILYSDFEPRKTLSGATASTEYPIGSLVTAYVVECNRHAKYLDLTLLPDSIGEFQVGDQCEATVTGVDDQCNLTLDLLPLRAQGLCRLTDVVDNYDDLSDKLTSFQLSPSVTCRIESGSRRGYIVSMRAGDRSGEPSSLVVDPRVKNSRDLAPNRNYRAFVMRSDASGVKVRLGTFVEGLVPPNKIHPDIESLDFPIFRSGRLVTVNICSRPHVKSNEKYVKCSMLPPQTGLDNQVDQNMISSLVGSRKRNISMSSDQSILSDRAVKRLRKREAPKGLKNLSDAENHPETSVIRKIIVDQNQPETNDINPDKKTEKPVVIDRLEIPADSKGLRLTSNRYSSLNLMSVGLAAAAGDSESTETPGKKKALRRKLLNPLNAPSTFQNESLARAVQDSPQDPSVWVAYMQHFLSVGDADRARAVGHQALRSIPVRDEASKLQIWTQLVKIEVEQGSEETIDSVVKEALRQNDELSFYKQLAEVYDEFGKHEQAERTYETMMKRFKHELQCYVLAGKHLMIRQALPKARQTMQRGIKHLSMKDHVQLIVQFGKMELEMGDKEKGKTLFETLLSSYPKRTDIWLTYIDLLVKHCDIELVRAVFEKLFLGRPSAKKAKVFYKKWLEIEERHGDPKMIEHVKAMALNTVQSFLDSAHADSE